MFFALQSTRAWKGKDIMMWDRQRIVSFCFRLLLTMVFIGAAARKFLSLPFEVASFVHFGYPLWFMYTIGALQLFGATLLWTRRYIAHGALLMAAIMVGAIASHLRAGDPILKPAPAVVLLILLLWLSYVHRTELLKQLPRTALLDTERPFSFSRAFSKRARKDR